MYDKVVVEECWEQTGNIHIQGVRSVDVNKGDDIHPEVRPMLAAKEMGKGTSMDLFAATPPIEAKQVPFCAAVTEGIGYKRNQWTYTLDFIDVRRAYFHAEARRTVYGKLPLEDREEGKCGRLKRQGIELEAWPSTGSMSTRAS